jgi:hypothetical protein
MAMTKSNQIGLMIGVPFTLLVVGLLVYLHLFATPTVPKPRDQGDVVPDLLVCEGEVPWLTEKEADKAIQFWKDHGHPMGVYKRVPCGSLEQCKTTEEKPRTMPCSRGHIVVSLRDQRFDDEHLGETVTVYDEKTGKVMWSAILLPSALLPPEGTVNEEGVLEVPEFPADVKDLVVTHEIGHWFGHDHVQTPLPGPFFAEPTGHILTRSVFKQGWGDAGLPETPQP